MNKPERPAISAPAEDLFQHVKDAGVRALQAAGDARETLWKRATDAPDEDQRRKKVLWLTGGAIGAIVATLFVTSRMGGESYTEPPTSTAQAVSVITLEGRAFRTTLSLSGEARPVRDIQVAAPATGVRILQILVDEGDTVREGQPMARLDTSLADAQTRAAEAAVAEAEASAVRARGEYERAWSIRDSGALSTEAIEQRRAAATAADARLSAARAELAEVNARLGGGYVRAPASGLVIDRMAELGRAVDGQVLFRIAADNRLEVSAQVAEGDALALQEGQVATFSLVDGSTLHGALRRLPASIDSRTRTGEALFTLPVGARVRAGMYLRGRLELPPRNVIAAPQSSVLYDNGQSYVLVVDQASRVHRTEVALGRRDGDWVEVTHGLIAGQSIVGAGAAFLQDGDEVRILRADDTRGRE
jgi:RND family efflux transporter MFP subunit